MRVEIYAEELHRVELKVRESGAVGVRFELNRPEQASRVTFVEREDTVLREIFLAAVLLLDDYYAKELEAQPLASQYAQSWPHPGATYEHYKGGRYVVIAIAEHHESREKLVVYRPVDSEVLSVRPLYGSKEDPDGWVIPVREGVPRFKAVVDVRPLDHSVD